MKRGMANESKALECIGSLKFALCCYENTMFGDDVIKWMPMSPDGKDTIDVSMLDSEIYKEELCKDTEISESSNYYVNSKL